MDKWKILKDEMLHSALPWLELTKHSIELPNGTIVNDYFQIKQPSYVEIAAIDKNDNVLMCRRYKHGVRDETFGFPGGYIEPNETALYSANRELHEECSLKSSNWTELGAFVIDGNRSTAKVHFFLARNIIETTKIKSDDIEETELIWHDINTIEKMMIDGKIKTLGAATLAMKLKQEI